MPTVDELRARLEAAQAEHEAAREKCAAFVVPPQGPDASLEEYLEPSRKAKCTWLAWPSRNGLSYLKLGILQCCLAF
jgi:hypothetical protein